VSRDALLNRLPEVLPQMEPVCDQQGIHSAERGAFGTGAGPVPADHLHPGMSRQPCGQWRRLATWQHLDGSMPLTIRDHSGVRVAAPGGEIVDTEDLWRVIERFGHCPNRVQQPHPPRCQTQGIGHSRPGTAGQRERDPVEQGAESISNAGVWAGQPWYLLSECALGTGAVSAYEAPHREQDPYRVPANERSCKRRSQRSCTRIDARLQAGHQPASRLPLSRTTIPHAPCTAMVASTSTPLNSASCHASSS